MLIFWPAPMLMWINSGNQPRWTAFAVIALAKQYRNETDPAKKWQYETLAKKGAEFLLWLQFISNTNGGIPFTLDATTNIGHMYATAIAGIAFVECYISFGDTEYKYAAMLTADWHLVHPGYPYTSQSHGYTYYSNVNHLARSLWNLSEVYSITGKQQYLDAAFLLSERNYCLARL